MPGAPEKGHREGESRPEPPRPAALASAGTDPAGEPCATGDVLLSSDALRRKCETCIAGPCVLDVTVANINDYCCGSFALVERDLRAVLPAPLAQAAIDLAEECQVPEAFRVREELVNFKKVMLHVHQQGSLLERSLARVATFFYDEAQEQQGFAVPSRRRSELTDARGQCKGRCA